MSFLVSSEGGRNLGMCKIADADKKSLKQYCTELCSGSKRLRTNKDVNQKRQGMSLAAFPT